MSSPASPLARRPRQLPEPSEFEYAGWCFSCTQGPIGSTNEFETLAQALNCHAPLPEMTYIHNELRLTHKQSGFTLSFSAPGALRAWHEAQTRHYVSEGKPVSAVAFDWTYARGDYDGDISFTRPANVTGTSASPAASSLAAATAATSGSSEGSTVPTSRVLCSGGAGGLSAELAGDAAAVAVAPDRYTACEREDTGRPLPLPLLLRRDPILFFHSITLYSDDLHDKGAVEISVKIRVMPRCFLVLLRRFLRIDGGEASVRDVRFCHVFQWQGPGRPLRGDGSGIDVSAADDAVAAAGAAADGATAESSLTSAAGGGGGGVVARFLRAAPLPLCDSQTTAAAAEHAPGSGGASDGRTGIRMGAEFSPAPPFCVMKAVSQCGGSTASIREALGLPPILSRAQLLAAAAEATRHEKAAEAEVGAAADAASAPLGEARTGAAAAATAEPMSAPDALPACGSSPEASPFAAAASASALTAEDVLAALQDEAAAAAPLRPARISELWVEPLSAASPGDVDRSEP